ncbi:MAG: LacI family DNA-binding transcriptional regulator [Caldilineaceae bacterium]
MSTIRDVAIKAGVHPSTVSRVFSGNAKISEETQTRVLDAAHKLGFHPNAIARSLSVKRTCTIAIVIPHIYSGYFDDEFFPRWCRGCSIGPTRAAIAFWWAAATATATKSYRHLTF